MKRKTNRLSKSEMEWLRTLVPTVDELRIIGLMRDYDSIRKDYFRKTIPAVSDILIRFLPRKEITRLSGFDDCDTDGLCSFGVYHGTPCLKAILLADDLTELESDLALRHEMAHMKVNLKFGRMMGEGENWKKEIRRLVAAGAYDGLL